MEITHYEDSYIDKENNKDYPTIVKDFLSSETKEEIKEKGESENDPFGRSDEISDSEHVIVLLSSKPKLSKKNICIGCNNNSCDKDNTEIKEIQECLIHNRDRLKRMLNNVRLLTLARSRMMTAFINDPDKDDWKKNDPGWTKKDIIP